MDPFIHIPKSTPNGLWIQILKKKRKKKLAKYLEDRNDKTLGHNDFY
jgi:hypothetical protein